MSRGDMFSRWTERKRRVAEEQAKAEPVPDPAPEAVAEPDEDEDAILARLDLPRPEDAEPGDIKRFLAREVPEFLRRRALHRLWRSHPTFAVLDGLNDYDEDFTAPEFNQKIVATAYQVGRGIVREIETALECETERFLEDADREVQVEDAEVEDTKVTSATHLPQETEIASEAADEAVEEMADTVFAPRRMRFDT